MLCSRPDMLHEGMRPSVPSGGGTETLCSASRALRFGADPDREGGEAGGHRGQLHQPVLEGHQRGDGLQGLLEPLPG